MNKDVYSNTEFTELKNRINAEIIRRGGYKWYDPLSSPKIGEDRTSPLSIPAVGRRVPVDDLTYTINNPSEGSIIRTKNIQYPAHGENPGGKLPTFDGPEPDTSAAALTVDELKNMIVGLTKMQDINLFYGRDEKTGIAFRDPQAIEDLVARAEQDELNEVYTTDNSPYTRKDYNGGISSYKNPEYPVQDPPTITFPIKDGVYVLPSGERDGEEIESYRGLGPHNFFDDYGAAPGDGNYHPYNKASTPQTRRDYYVYDKDRHPRKVIVVQGGIKSSEYGANPRNPNQGNEYKAMPVFKGTPGTCNGNCTGLCYQTCDSQCSESCSVTCTVRCGNSCTATCGNVCTGCSTLCYSSCQTKCENAAGYACVKSGAKAVKIWTTGGHDGVPAENHLEAETYTCQGCSFSCQFYPNKKTECWDSGCMGKCFTSCSSACSTSCKGGCINNDATGTKGQGCSAGCTINCSGTCEGSCEGMCTQSCFHQCKELCSDNCTWECSTTCGAGCDTGCTNGCTGCDDSCDSYCNANADMHGCTGCSIRGGCTSTCQFDCNQNCISQGCRSMCGIDGAGACTNNCRISCSTTSCTSQCSDQCTNQCSTCVNTCGWGCGHCSSLCSNGCESECGITCTATCEHSCETNCIQSCSEECGGCSSLCYSCVGMCIGVCSLKCESNCSSCANQCGWWCDVQCNQACFSNCDDQCMLTCSGTCATFADADADLPGPEREPTSQGYSIPHPSNRVEERESFKLIKGEYSVDLFKIYLTERGELIIEYIGAEDFDLNIHVNDDGYIIMESNDTPLEIVMNQFYFSIVNNDLMVVYEEEWDKGRYVSDLFTIYLTDNKELVIGYAGSTEYDPILKINMNDLILDYNNNPYDVATARLHFSVNGDDLNVTIEE